MTKPGNSFVDNMEEALRNKENDDEGKDGKIDVFLSYSSLNKNVADAVVSEFEQHGIRCWYAPRDIIPGQEWVSAIHDAIKSCRLFVLIYTDSSNESKQVANEVALAFNSGKTLIPFKLSDAEMSSELEYYLTRVHWLDAVKPPLRKSIESLREYSEKILDGNIPKDVYDKNSQNTTGRQPSRFLLLPFIAAMAVICVAAIFMLLKNKDNKESSPESAEKQVEITSLPTEADAMYELAAHYYEEGSEESIKKALDLYEKAAAAGNVNANNFMGSYYVELEKEREVGAESVIGKAISYYEVSAEKEDAVALYSLGYIYENENNDLGIEPDNVKALKYYEKAMNAGNSSAAKAYERVKKKMEK